MKNFTIKTGLAIISIVLLLSPLASCGRSVKQWNSPPEMVIDTSKTYTAVFDTSFGTFRVELWADKAPQTVNSFVFLANENFFDGLTFHRIIQNFMIQGGNPQPYNYEVGTIQGPGYTFDDELSNVGSYDPGVIAMANSGPNTNGSQFFICTGNAAYTLEPKYTQFGKVLSVDDMAIVNKIAAVDVELVIIGTSYEFSKPVKPPVINHVTIEVR
ncbi:MAG: peptidylprolyl isomerase [Dehalococcoidia bacterium]|nr:peptidylprolyl isomerase [Dehalococcoidia bacterium]